MLKHLYISNFTLIDELDVVFFPGFSVITGETGAGKSIIVGATGLLLGSRADAKQIKTGRNKCVVEATFEIDDRSKSFVRNFFEKNDLDDNVNECVLRREVNSNGKSRAFVNDTPVVLSTLKELGEHLVDIHSQHQNLMLNKEDFQLNVIDVFAGNRAIWEDYNKSFQEYKKAKKELDDFKEGIAKSHEGEDFLRFQQKELSEARLETGEQERLEQQSEVMTHAEEIKGGLYSVSEILNGEDIGVLGQLKNALNLLQGIERVYGDAADMRTRVDNSFIELKELSREIAGSMEYIDFDPDELHAVNSRLDMIYTLEKKYQAGSIVELLKRLDDINSRLSRIDNYDDELAKMEERVAKLMCECGRRADKLTEARRKAAVKVEKELSERLMPLGIPNVQFKVEMEQVQEFLESGRDKVLFLFSSNSGFPMRPISQIASGGEISRVMLSLKAMMSHKVGFPTIIFDEIDTGVSGRVAEKMAHMMKEMGTENHQVICITHLPQIAAVGNHHYKVAKHDRQVGSVSTMKILDDDERIKEIAQMLSGSDISEAAIDNAKSLLNIM